MAKKLNQNLSIVAGIADSLKSNQPNAVAFERAVDFRTDPFQYTINPRTERQAAGVVTDLPMWMDLACDNLYAYGNSGNIYLKDSDDNWSVDTILPNSQGNGLVYFPEDGYLYAAQDKTIARKSEACSTDGVWYAGFLESEGGEPTNQKSITFVRASSQYASIADNVSLSITDDISFETYIKFTTLPATNEIQTLISKWNESGNQRSYKFDLTTSSNAFGDGRDGALTISSNSTEDPVDANCTGTSGQYTLTVTNAHASFASIASGDRLFIHQTRGTDAGRCQFVTVQSYAGGVVTLQEALTFSPAHSATTTVANKAQVRLLKQYTNVTVNAGNTYSCKAWNGLKGGILGWYANGTETINGTLNLAGGDGVYVGPSDNPGSNTARQTPTMGFGGGEVVEAHNPSSSFEYGYRGEGSSGDRTTAQGTANGNGGGGAGYKGAYNTPKGAGGGGGGNGTAGSNGTAISGGGGEGVGGIGGAASSTTDLTTITFGGGGGGGCGSGGGEQGTGGAGGAMFVGKTKTFVMGASSSITLNGGAGAQNHSSQHNGGGGGGGSFRKHVQDATLLTNKITASGGTGGYQTGGTGGDGVIAIYYSGTVTGTTTPTANLIYDATLASTDGYVLRLLISSNGTNSETYTQDVTDSIQTGVWNRWAVTWDAPTSTANFYQNAVLLGTQTGSFTSIANSTARFAIATSYNSAGNPENFLDAKMDDTRVWNSVRSATELAYYNDRVLVGTETNNSAYYKFEGNVNDSQTYTTTSNLTATNTPTYSTDVPFAGITTRSDQDININAVGSTYTLGTSLSESANDRQTFTPTKEPIKSVQLNINTVGTGNWTVVIHDALNRELASTTVANAQLHTSYYEFVLSESVRPILGADYHVHVYDTTGDGKIVTSGLNNMEGTTGDTGAYFATFFQILVEDVYHPMTQFQNFVVVGNERYVGKLEAGNIYDPHHLVLPAGYRVRCFAKWNEFLAIGVWKGNSITDTDQGKIFLWDGSTDTSGTANANTIVDVLEGGVNSMYGAGGILSIIAGYEGKLLLYGGGATQKVDQIPLLERDEYCEIAPGSMTMWRSILRFGATINTDSSHVHQGVYGYGRLNTNYPNALGFDFPLSIGDAQSSMVKVGCLFPAGQSLYIGWQNGNTYGIDMVSVTNDCYASATVEDVIIDLRRMSQQKLPLVYRVDFEPLTAGQSVTVKCKINRESSWRVLEVEDTVGATEIRAIVHDQVKEIQFARDIASTSGVSPVIIQSALESDDQGDTIPA